MTGVDAGYLIGTVDPRDELRPRVEAWGRTLRGVLLVHDYVTLEVVNHFSATPLRERCQVVLRQFLMQPNVEFVHVDEELREAEERLHRDRSDKKWSLTDCVSFVLMQRRGVRRALAYDHHFEQAGFEPLLRRDPS